MNCDTSISEFLAGISILSVAVHIGIAFCMRPRMLSVTFDPIQFGTVTKIPSRHVPEKENDVVSSEPEKETEKPKSEGIYSYFT
jgi:Zn finger protein HypA/HybF involved in hydrogenase expression